MKLLTRIFGILSVFLCFGGHAIGSPQAVVQVVDPFDGVWLHAESPDLFVRVVNIGDAPFSIDVHNDVVIEQEGQPDQPEHNTPEFWIEYGLGRGDPFARVPATKGEGGIEIPPGHAFALNEVDLKDGPLELGSWPEMMPVRAHIRIADGNWVSSDWVDRRMLLWTVESRGQSLFDFDIRDSVGFGLFKISISDEYWLVVGSDDNWHFISRVCKVPADIEPIGFSHDRDLRRLYVEFAGDEEDVIVDTRFGVPITGSEQTVPHLHKWLAFSGRPYRDSDPDEYPRVIRIPDEELAALRSAARANQSETEQSRQARCDPGGTDEPKQWIGSMAFWLAIVVAAALLAAVCVAVVRSGKRWAKGIP